MKKSCATTLFICFFILWCIGKFSNTEEEKVPLYNDIDAVVEKAGYIIQDDANDLTVILSRIFTKVKKINTEKSLS